LELLLRNRQINLEISLSDDAISNCFGVNVASSHDADEHGRPSLSQQSGTPWRNAMREIASGLVALE
jgi:hypothetical protein